MADSRVLYLSPRPARRARGQKQLCLLVEGLRGRLQSSYVSKDSGKDLQYSSVMLMIMDDTMRGPAQVFDS